MGASRRMAPSHCRASILRDAVLRTAPQDEVVNFFTRSEEFTFRGRSCRPLTSVICLKIGACLNKSGAAAALQQGALAGGAGGVTGHADVVRRMGRARRKSPNRGGSAREVELEGAGRHRNGRRGAHLHWQRNEDDFRGGAAPAVLGSARPFKFTLA